MQGISTGKVSLYLTELEGRKGLCFMFGEGNTFYPVAYVSARNDAKAREMWQKLIDPIPDEVKE